MSKLSSLARNGVAALALGAFGATLSVPTQAQIPPGMGAIPGMGMFTTIELTDELVVNFIAAYPTVTPALDTIGDRYNVPEGNDPAAAMAALAMLGAATAEMNGLVTPFGFADFSQYSAVLSTILSAYAFADPTLTAQDRAMMAQFLPPIMMPTDANVAIVAAHYADLKAVVDTD